MNRKNTSNHFWHLVAGICLWLAMPIYEVAAQQYSFKKIGLEEGLPSNRINDFLQDSRGFYWLATDGAGLVRYDGFEFKTVEVPSSSLNPLVTALAEDSSGNIWFCNTNALIKYNGLGFRHYYLPVAPDRISRILLNPEGEIFVAGRQKVYRVAASDTLEVIPSPEISRINDIAWYQRDLWYASVDGLYKNQEKFGDGNWANFDVDGEHLLVAGVPGLIKVSDEGFDTVSTVSSQWIDHRVNRQIRLSRNQLFVDDDKSTIAISVQNGLTDSDFDGCYIDESLMIWLYSGKGLLKLENTGLRLYGEESGLISKVHSVMIDDNGNLAAGKSNGLSIVEGTQVKNVIGSEFPYGVILSMETYNGYTWLGTETGLVRYDGNRYQKVNLNGVNGIYVFSLKANAEGLWIGTSAGLFSIQANKVSNVTMDEGLPMGNVFSISQGLDGSLWCATYTQGFMLKGANGWQNIRRLGDVSFDSLRFNAFTAISESEIWASTLTEGLFNIKSSGHNIISPSALGFAEIQSLINDEDGRLWVGSNKGISWIAKREGEFKINPLRPTARLMPDGCSSNAIALKNGILLLGTPKGLLSLSTAQILEKKVDAKIAITDVELFFGQVEGLENYAEHLSPFTLAPSNLELPHGLNFLSFTLAGLSGYQPNELVYRYRISGQASWTLAGNRREAIYSNLKPGSYNFEAEVSRDGENWSSHKVSLPFVINQPLWQRWWFIALMVLFVAGIVFTYLAARVKRINQRLRLENSLLEMERKALRLQMNPHFIFNALDSISSFIFKNDPKQAVRYLNNFAKLMRLTLESSMEHFHPVETEVSILKNYLELEKLRFQGKFEYQIEVDEEIDFDIGIPPMLIQPHVENAILHGLKPMKELGHLTIRFILEDNLLICQVEDNGIGREKARELPSKKDHRSMATQINKDRLRVLKRAMGGDIDINIIDKKDPTGTLVIIKLPIEHI